MFSSFSSWGRNYKETLCDLGHELCRLKVGVYDTKHSKILIQFLLVLKDCTKKNR